MGVLHSRRGWGSSQALGALFQGLSLTSHPQHTSESLLTLEHNTVCWGGHSYCHVKGLGEQRVGTAQCWKSTWREKGSVNVQ